MPIALHEPLPIPLGQVQFVQRLFERGDQLHLRGNFQLSNDSLLPIEQFQALVATTLPRLQHEKELNTVAAQAASSPPRVSVVTAHRAPATSTHVLPGNAQAFREAALFARTTGYLKRWLVDIGDRVREGQLIADISAPDVDDQLAQARANLSLSKANLLVSEASLILAKTTLARDTKAREATAAANAECATSTTSRGRPEAICPIQ